MCHTRDGDCQRYSAAVEASTGGRRAAFGCAARAVPRAGGGLMPTAGGGWSGPAGSNAPEAGAAGSPRALCPRHDHCRPMSALVLVGASPTLASPPSHPL